MRPAPSPLPLLLLLLLPALAAQPPAACARDARFLAAGPPALTGARAGHAPVGGIIAWPFPRDPRDSAAWLDCDGRAVQAADYPALVAVLAGPSAASARLPDLRGVFLRGFGSRSVSQENGTLTGVTATLHRSGPLGVLQGDAMRRITGTLPGGGRSRPDAHAADGLRGAFFRDWSSRGPGSGETADGRAPIGFDSGRVTPGAEETRPVNMAVRWLIRAL